MPSYQTRPLQGRAGVKAVRPSVKVVQTRPGEPGKPIWSNPVHSTQKRGDLTGATRPPYPPVFRKFGKNTRATVYPLPNRGILDNTYDQKIVQSHSVPAFLPGQAVDGPSCCPILTKAIPNLRPGSNHYLFGSA